jgi:hypothetical protein
MDGLYPVGSEHYIERIRKKLGLIARKRQVSKDDESMVIREPRSAYSVHFDAKNGLSV